MEALCPNLDLKPTPISPISRKPSKPTSVLFHSCRLWGSNSKKFRASIPQASYKTRSEPQFNGEDIRTDNQKLLRSIGRGVFGFAAAAMAAVSICSDSPALAESLTVAFPVSRAREVNTVQRTLVEAWGLIRETFIDPTFNHQDWDMKLQQTMVEIFPLRSADAAYNKIGGMLSTLGDPFTRIISPKEYQSFRIGSDGNLQGVGLFINVEPKTGHLVVLSCVEGSPAARSGIHEGDELVEINGEKLDGIDSESAAQKLRGRAGTTVTVKLHSGNDERSDSSLREFKLPREFIKLSPISSAIIPHRSSDGRLSKTGYVKLSAFSQTVAADMENAIQEMENQGVHSYILDLRNNPGGLVKAGLDVAQIWLDGDETLVNTIDRDGNMLPINMVDGHALTHDPLVVLVNEGSASASEILAGALHDNGRAILVGNKTFGKGKIQDFLVIIFDHPLQDFSQVNIFPVPFCCRVLRSCMMDRLCLSQLQSIYHRHFTT
ncbi:carboxyl-terminal-processing peptidase 3, chloroplastic isoform X2 [Cornus florida]|uniref:carboxyl-terminal-processing peptidase 3, chloroplastic isoform X2 n=1 Tax=Cornus florida TaxID=4283 RepID=UPI0028984B64|nr:carboxyl-terminal-processing peptidase 3, chloroplastic isoform X2 [Cornus florida]